MTTELTPEKITQLGLGFWGSKTLLSAIELGLFTELAKGPLDSSAIANRLRLHPRSVRDFLDAMTGISLGAAVAIAQKFPWKNYKTFVDIGPAQGALPVQVALAHSHLTGAGFDLGAVRTIFEKYVAKNGLSDRLKFISGNF